MIAVGVASQTSRGCRALKLLKKRPRTFDIQVQDLVLHISAGTDFNEESRAAALSFWEQLQAYALRNPEIRTSKRPIDVPKDAPAIVREMVRSARTAGVGPIFSFQGAVTDYVGRFLAEQSHELTVSCGGDYFIVARKRQKLTVLRKPGGESIAVVVQPLRDGVGISTTVGRGRATLDGLAVLASSCMLADAAAAGVQAILPKDDGFRLALGYLKRVPGVHGGLVVLGERIGVAGNVEIAA
jgi:ApbE superfamily uncharacterized protein (UPF0280 family)